MICKIVIRRQLLFQYCKEVCVTTKCGEFTLPDNHLKSCKTCDADGRRCRENAPNRKTRGIENADFVLYVSALPTSQCSETIGMYLIWVRMYSFSFPLKLLNI